MRCCITLTRLCMIQIVSHPLPRVNISVNLPLTAHRFVTQAHVQDENFIRIGKHLESAKMAKGVTKL